MKNNRESLYVRYLRFFYGIEGPLDEYREEAINKLAGKLFLVIWNYFTLSTTAVWIALLVTYFTSKAAQLIVLWWFGANALAIMTIGTYISLKIHKLKIDRIDVSNQMEYHAALKKMKRAVLIQGIFLLLATRISQIIYEFLSYGNDKSIVELILSPVNNLIFLGVTALVTIGNYITKRRKIDREYHE
ncbi:DUF3278 domain-containing protein [Lactobacillus sp. Sy-1]|uniref:DUF3278 domain-containing protein n=1 Tax=Lactobacillus sp. Sy-1 TaxID=2109645 RepID=UPI001C5AF606|nr:DUF3278 domain-containing protein [Lactobacillus sp. Sy-1]MBW1606393.1 DUF3278 domain-containing protein [Lactobacillus sp. Sy-1]